jgi:hypothetical protein
MSEGHAKTSATRITLLSWFLLAFLLYCMFLAMSSFAYAPEGDPALGRYLAIRVFGLSLAVTYLCFLRSRRVRVSAPILENPVSD